MENCAILRGLLQALPAAPVARDVEVFDFIDRHALAEAGIGYIDAHLLCAVALAGTAQLGTRDKRLGAVAESLASGHTT